MASPQRSISRLVLLGFVFRALIPVGLMLQLPAVAAEEQQFGFVLCPLQNPGLDFSKLEQPDDSSHASAHHHHAGPQTKVNGESQDSTTVSAQTADSLCTLWASGAQSNLTVSSQKIFHQRSEELTTYYHSPALPQTQQTSARVTRAPPISR